jgi:hypothetical protein
MAVEELSQDFQRIIFEHHPREAMLASFAKQSSTVVWHDVPPRFLSQVLLNDVTLLTS